MQNRRKKKNPLSEESGIYAIINVYNGKFYVGSSNNTKRRRKDHFYHLTTNTHHNLHLQNSFLLYGQESFIFYIIDFCDETELLELEQFYIDTLEPEYNICKIAGSPIGYKHTKEARKKISESKIGIKLSEKTRKKMSESRTGENNPWYGKFGSNHNKSKKVIQYNLLGEVINEFSAVREATRITGIDNSTISKACNGKLKSAGGFFWRYVA